MKLLVMSKLARQKLTN